MDEFNPHGNTTSNGTTITLGLVVLDYDFRMGKVIADRYATMHDHGHCNGDHWFEVQHDDGSTKDFNGERLQAVRS